MAQESVVLLASACRDAAKVAHKVSLLEGELAVACQAWDTVETKLSCLVDKAADIGDGKRLRGCVRAWPRNLHFCGL
jgi:hypothetical protein